MVEGLDKDGNVAGSIDWKWHVGTWKAVHSSEPHG